MTHPLSPLSHALRLRLLLAALIAVATFSSCIDEAEHPDTRQGNFEALWQILDEHYCFFAEKQALYGLDWQAVYAKYRMQVTERMTESQLFEVCGNMLSELRDGHVNLSTSYDFARYWSWHENYPANFSDSLHRRYLGTDYKIASGLKYRILDDNIGYVYYERFSDGIGEGNLDEVILSLMLCRGLILDIRNNTGGNLTNAEKLAARFINEPTLVGYMRHKTGKGHDDFSPLEEQWLKPSSNLRWQKRVCVLTNRKVYSAANEFVKYMSCVDNATIVGDQTGGGAGLPFMSSLPNGWAVRFSACPMFDRYKQSTEAGIAPDHAVSLLPEDEAKGLDTVIEVARQLLAR